MVSSYRGELQELDQTFDLRKLREVSDRFVDVQEEDAIGFVNHLDIQRDNPLINETNQSYISNH